MFKALHDEIKNDGYVYFITKVGEAFEAKDSKIFKAKAGDIIDASFEIKPD